MSKRINSFFQPIPSKKPKQELVEECSVTNHPTYPFAIRDLPSSISTSLINRDSPEGKHIANQPHLDLLHFNPFVPAPLSRQLFHFLRRELPFYRVHYTINRGGLSTEVKTPRYTTVFGVDSTSRFAAEWGSTTLLDSASNQPAPENKYKVPPRPIPPCLDTLRQCVEAATNRRGHYNFILVNYYATGDDSIAYHSDDERFLGAQPAIASLSLGGTRDFLLKRKSSPPGSTAKVPPPVKFAMASGDMVIMQGETQAHWLHGVPKRRGSTGGQGRINITFRRAVIPEGTNNYYRYNVGQGEMYRWCEARGEMPTMLKMDREAKCIN
ncbi:DNA repair family protein [Aspergillus campestris IBT 28561]|uniref:DNA repair family protein n=1 Tax=Aspergillus campestris (strain IBT 28561) TaxID=1392248 RepID=A0A2I1CQX7_ASPC2|nr:DNA repair family protein [Aspergillus campestris IBT 28561]PKY00031.1 DNA repair family protein [Aspergillus campestris IBT 28561]